VDRPREEWTEIPVPAIVDQDTFARVQQRLADNKRFATRGSKAPSLLQGLAACPACGYGYYRSHATTTAGNKIYYYRCPGSDNYRYEGGRICGNKPVRADYPGTVVWDHITALLADPALIRTEIGRRLEQAGTSDPVTRQRQQLELALAKAGASITAMAEAFSEQLITIDELRAKMPDLRAREASLRGQLDALDAQAADRDAYLKLAGDLEAFLTRLHGSATTASTDDRRRVLRLLVKDVLIGPEKITIRHRIPVREPPSGGGHHDTTDTIQHAPKLSTVLGACLLDFYLLEAAGLDVQLVNAREARNMPGRPKSDRLDAVWLAKLTERGMLRPSFVPPAEIRELRGYTRLRTDLVQERTRH
jgi:site-specific DNA recombinase